MEKSQPLFIPDWKDKRIVELLKADCRISQENIAQELNISRPTVQKRIKTLEENHIILGYTIITDEKKLGKEIVAFILLKLDRSRRAWSGTYSELLKRVNEIEILEIHHITGDDDVLIKMRTRNIDSLEANLIEITQIKGVFRTRTMICLSSIEHGGIISTIIETEQRPPPKDILWNFT